MFYVVIMYCVYVLLKWLIMSVSKLLVTLWVGNSGEMKYFL